MAYVPPTAEDFKTRFPEFESVEDDTITALLADAAKQVDSTWREDDRAIAEMLMVAHSISSQETASSGGREIASESIGPLSVSYFSGASLAWIQGTGYGRAWYALALKNFPPILVV